MLNYNRIKIKHSYQHIDRIFLFKNNHYGIKQGKYFKLIVDDEEDPIELENWDDEIQGEIHIFFHHEDTTVICSNFRYMVIYKDNLKSLLSEFAHNHTCRSLTLF